jgi:hypothetical protein
MCGELWETGELGRGQIVPRLASCVRHREVKVFPGPPSTCSALGLRALPSGYQLAATRMTAFTDRVAEVAAECTTEAEFEANMRAVYAEFGHEFGGGHTFHPIPGRDCVGGWPRPMGLLYALTGNPVPSETTAVIRSRADARAFRRAERRRKRRLQDEHDYFHAMVFELQRQLCDYDELRPDREACLAKVSKAEREARHEPPGPTRSVARFGKPEEVKIKRRDLPPKVREALDEATKRDRANPPRP